MNKEQLNVATGYGLARAEKWLAPIKIAMIYYNIDTPIRQAMFLAQIGHESGGLRYTTEIWGPTPAQTRYEGRKDLGNTQPGDGYKYRGRGLLQVTGRANYREVGKALGIDIESNPDRLCDEDMAAESAAYFWKSRKLNAYADKNDCRGCTRIINGGYNGLEERLQLFAKAYTALTNAAPAPTPLPESPLILKSTDTLTLPKETKS